MKLGVHTSIAGGIDKAIDRAVALNCNTLQIFSSNPRGWKVRDLKAEEIKQVKIKLKENNLAPLVIHSPYLLNLASPKKELYQKSIKNLTVQIKRADILAAEYLVLHPGSHVGSGDKAGIKRIGLALEQIIKKNDFKVKILLENVAGAGTGIGSSIKQLAQIVSFVNDADQLGLCFDTCHGFAARYKFDKSGLDKLIKEVENYFGLDKLAVIHLNDSKRDFASAKDRHQHIGQGKIGRSNFSRLVNHPKLKDKTFILETPVDDNGDDRSNLSIVRNLVK